MKITVSKVYDYNPSDSQVPFKARNVDYTDPTGQTFRLTVYAENAEAVDAYIKPLALCFEAQQITPPDNLALLAQVDEMQPDVILREEAVKAAGYDPAQTSDLLQKYLTAIAAGKVTDVKDGNPSLASLLRWAGADPVKVLGAALDRFTSEWGAKFGSQVPGEAYSVVKDSYSTALSDDGSDRLAALIPPVPLPEQGGLSGDQSIVTVKFDWLNYPQEKQEEWSVSYALDPPLPQYKWHLYEWKWMRSVTTQIYVDSGSISLYLWRWNGGYNYRDSSWAGTGNWSRSLSASTGSSYWYRAAPYGWDASNDYDMYGTWWNSTYYTYP